MFKTNIFPHDLLYLIHLLKGASVWSDIQEDVAHHNEQQSFRKCLISQDKSARYDVHPLLPAHLALKAETIKARMTSVLLRIFHFSQSTIQEWSWNRAPDMSGVRPVGSFKGLHISTFHYIWTSNSGKLDFCEILPVEVTPEPNSDIKRSEIPVLSEKNSYEISRTRG